MRVCSFVICEDDVHAFFSLFVPPSKMDRDRVSSKLFGRLLLISMAQSIESYFYKAMASVCGATFVHSFVQSK